MARNHEQLSNPGWSGTNLGKEIIAEQIRDQKFFFNQGHTRGVDVRKQALKKLRKAVAENYDAIKEALRRDLKKPEFETYITEIAFVFQEIDLAMKRLPKWARPKKIKNPWLLWPSRSFAIPEPLGTTLIIGPWNYPFQLTMAPLVAAIAAGNTAIVKPSEVAPHTSRILHEILGSTFAPEYVTVVEGGVETTQSLLSHHFDKIFFTGGVAVGKIVMAAAAKHLTPVTLELGGKSPAIIARDAPVQKAARKIAWGKCINSGQTCLAPDYVLVHRDLKDDFLTHFAHELRAFYGDDPQASPHYARIIHSKQVERIKNLQQDSTVLYGGHSDKDDLYIEPTLLEPSSPNAPIMEEEIFGPLLPVIEFSTLEEAISIIKRKEKPLAIYLFTHDKKSRKQVMEQTSSGGIVVNDTLIHVANSHLPFGGVGESGMGAYHGIHGFNEFSHLKSAIIRRFHFDLLFRYPPYNVPLRWLRKLLG